MADLVSDGKVKVQWVPSVANVSAPTVAEINAGTSLECLITPNGLKINSDTAEVDTSALCSTFDTASAGRRKFTLELMFKRFTPTDTAYNLLPYRTSGYLVVRRNLDNTTAFAATQVVEVYPVQSGEPQLEPPAANEVQKFTSKMMLTADPDTRAVVA